MILLIQLNDPQLAQMLADYLQSRHMPCQLQVSETGVSLWLLDDKQAAMAEQEVQRFVRNRITRVIAKRPGNRKNPRHGALRRIRGY